MAKKFRSKKKKKYKIFKIILFLLIIYLFFQIFYHFILKLNIASSNEEFIRKMLDDSNHHMIYEKYNQNLASNTIKVLSLIDIKKPTTLLKQTFGYNIDTSMDLKDIEVASDVDETENTKTDTDYIKDPNPTKITKPKVYIYNTHQLEGYSASNFEDYNITPNVLMASYMLKEKLNKINIPTIVETSNIRDFLNLNGWDYASSYKASRFYMIDTLNKYDSLDLLIDLHRDAIPKDKSTVTIKGKNYAKVLFVVGVDHENHKKNLELAGKLNSLLKQKRPEIVRGVITKGGAGVNGVYNQDLSPNVILIECGGKDNSIDEVMNTIEVLTQVIKEYIGD